MSGAEAWDSKRWRENPGEIDYYELFQKLITGGKFRNFDVIRCLRRYYQFLEVNKSLQELVIHHSGKMFLYFSSIFILLTPLVAFSKNFLGCFAVILNAPSVWFVFEAIKTAFYSAFYFFKYFSDYHVINDVITFIVQSTVSILCKHNLV